MKEDLKDIEISTKEYITVERRIYDSMKLELHMLRDIDPLDTLIEKVKNKDGIVFFYKDLLPKFQVGFITHENMKKRLSVFIELSNRFEKLPKIIKYLIKKHERGRI
jgi:hypothetical protein